jgi:hypothetical protein
MFIDLLKCTERIYTNYKLTRLSYVLYSRPTCLMFSDDALAEPCRYAYLSVIDKLSSYVLLLK